MFVEKDNRIFVASASLSKDVGDRRDQMHVKVMRRNQEFYQAHSEYGQHK